VRIDIDIGVRLRVFERKGASLVDVLVGCLLSINQDLATTVRSIAIGRPAVGLNSVRGKG